jgi:SHAQKYF class myb-like DNA-binding protein
MSVETRSATLTSSLSSNIDPTRKALETSPVEPISIQAASTYSTDTRDIQASLKTRTVTEESLANNEQDAALFDGIDADQISNQYYRIRITPPPSLGRESPLLFAASFDQGDTWQPPVVTPLPTIMSQPPQKDPTPVKSMPPAPPIISKAPTKPASHIHHHPTISVPRTLKAAPSMDSPTSENTGRWTAEEHRLFLQGLEEHGKGWKKIASLIQTRTVVQIRTHAQKYFQKLAKARANGEEEEKIVAAAVPMRTVPGNMSVGTDSVSLAAAAGQVGTGALPPPKRSRRNVGGTKRRAIGSVVRSSVREGRTYKRQKMLEGKNKVPPSDVPNPLPSISSLLDPYVMAPPVMGVQPMEVEDGKKRKSRGRQQLVNTATHGTLPMAALEDAV